MPPRLVLAAALGLAGALAASDVGAEHGEVRLRVALVLDASMSMEEQDPRRLSELAAHLLVDLATPRDEVSVIRFGTAAERLGREVVRDEAARARLHAAVDRVGRAEWCTDYRGGLEAALDALPGEQRTGERHLVIFLTDGLFDPDRSNESYYRNETGRQALERARRSPLFAERPCARGFAALVPHVEDAFLEGMERLAARLSGSGVRLYTVGLGPALAADGAASARSRTLLERLAASTGGAFLAATTGEQLPGFFASIYSALVGAPVEPRLEAPPDEASLVFELLRGASRAAVVVDAGIDRELEVEARGPGGVEVAPARRSFQIPGEAGEGYRLLVFESPEPGRHEVVRTEGRGRLAAQVIQEVGLRLAVDGLPEVAPEGVAPRLAVGLRTEAGEPVRLSPELLARVRVVLRVTREGGDPLLDRTLSLPPGGDATVALEPMTPGSYRLEAAARHEQGLLEVAPVHSRATVLHQIRISFEPGRVVFDGMAEAAERLEGGARLSLAAGSELPVEQELLVDWSGVSGLDDLVVGPERITLGPERRSVEVEVCLRDARALRRVDRRYAGAVVLTPVRPELFAGGEARWVGLVVEGRVRPWTLGRYFREHRVAILGGLAALLLLLWVVGRLVASKWPKKARLHFVELDDPARAVTTLLLRRRSSSSLPFRSDRHRCGRGGLPGRRGRRRLCDLVARGRSGFVVVPRDEPVVYDKAGEQVSARKPFAGRWEERYRLGERFEIWLTRT